jgi:hypothetical protein
LFEDTAGTTPAVDDGDAVARINDSMASGNNTTQGTAGARPTLKLNIINGLPVLRADGGDSLMIAGNGLLRNKASAMVIMLVKFTDVAAIRYGFMISVGGGAGSPRAAMAVNNVSSRYEGRSRRLDADSTVAGGGGTLDTNAWVVLTVEYNYAGNAQVVRINGVQVDSDAYSGAGNTSDTDSAGMRLMADGSGGNNMIGDWIEWLIWDAIPPTAIRNAVETYLMALVA